MRRFARILAIAFIALAALGLLISIPVAFEVGSGVPFLVGIAAFVSGAGTGCVLYLLASIDERLAGATRSATSPPVSRDNWQSHLEKLGT